MIVDMAWERMGANPPEPWIPRALGSTQGLIWSYENATKNTTVAFWKAGQLRWMHLLSRMTTCKHILTAANQKKEPGRQVYEILGAVPIQSSEMDQMDTNGSQSKPLTVSRILLSVYSIFHWKIQTAGLPPLLLSKLRDLSSLESWITSRPSHSHPTCPSFAQGFTGKRWSLHQDFTGKRQMSV